jgi:protein-L-isoaspartate(D-aspartate) O-methyltransferase
VVKSRLAAYDVRSRTAQPPVNDKAAFMNFMKANTTEEEKHLSARWDRMANDKRLYPDTPERVFQAFLLTPREFFVRPQNIARAYDHAWLAIEDGQTISGPHMVLRETATINPDANHKVLEIGTGSGYQAAVLAQ